MSNAIIINPFEYYSILSLDVLVPQVMENKKEWSQGVIYDVRSWCCNIEWIVEPDPSYFNISTLEESWLC